MPLGAAGFRSHKSCCGGPPQRKMNRHDLAREERFCKREWDSSAASKFGNVSVPKATRPRLSSASRRNTRAIIRCCPVACGSSECPQQRAGVKAPLNYEIGRTLRQGTQARTWYHSLSYCDRLGATHYTISRTPLNEL